MTAHEMVTRIGPSVLDCLEAAMRADPSLTVEEAVRTVPVSEETLQRGAGHGLHEDDDCQ